MNRRSLTAAVGLWIQLMIRLMIQTEAATSSSSLNCSVSQLHNGHFLYQLSQTPTSGKCDTCWEDQNKTVLARGSDFQKDIVQSVTNESIEMIKCHDYLLYTWECNGVVEETSCRVNCSEFIGTRQTPSSFCFSSSVCVCELAGGLIIGLSIGLIVLGLIIWFVWMKCKKRRSSNNQASLTEMEPFQRTQTNSSTEGGEKLNGATV